MINLIIHDFFSWNNSAAANYFYLRHGTTRGRSGVRGDGLLMGEL